MLTLLGLTLCGGAIYLIALAAFLQIVIRAATDVDEETLRNDEGDA